VNIIFHGRINVIEKDNRTKYAKNIEKTEKREAENNNTYKGKGKYKRRVAMR
jgi:hypothetical protein